MKKNRLHRFISGVPDNYSAPAVLWATLTRGVSLRCRFTTSRYRLPTLFNRIVLTGILLILTAFDSAGQEITDVIHSIEKVTVFETRPVRQSALSVTEIDSTQMSEVRYSSFAELLTRHTTLFVKTYRPGALATVSFRGTQATHTQVEWNGININGPMLGQVDFALIPVWLTDRVELYHGGSSLQMGSGGLGGLVSINSIPQWGNKLTGSLGQSAGSFGTYQSFVSASGGSDKVHAKVRYYYEQSDNDFKYRNLTSPSFETVRLRDARHKRHGGAADIFWKAGRNNTFSLNLWYHQSRRQLPPPMSYEGLGKDESQFDREVRAVGKWLNHASRIRSELTLGFVYMQLDYRLSNYNGTEWRTSQNSRSNMNSYHLRYNLDYNISARTVLRGKIDGRYNIAGITNGATYIDPGRDIYRKERAEAGASISIHHSFSRKLSGFALLREDFIKDGFSPVMPSAGLEYRPLGNDILIFKSNAARNYRHPTLNELYWTPGGNPDLRPEKDYTVDISGQLHTSNNNFSYDLSATGYFSWMDDLIFWEPRTGNSLGEMLSVSNLKEVLSRGLEIVGSVGYTFGDAALKLGGNYAFTKTTKEKADSANDDSVGKQLPYIPVHKLNLMLSSSYKSWYVFWVWSYVSERYTRTNHSSTRHRLQPYDLHNVTIGKDFNLKRTRLNLEFKLNNIFAKEYQEMLWAPTPLRNFSLMAKISF